MSTNYGNTMNHLSGDRFPITRTLKNILRRYGSNRRVSAGNIDDDIKKDKLTGRPQMSIVNDNSKGAIGRSHALLGRAREEKLAGEESLSNPVITPPKSTPHNSHSSFRDIIGGHTPMPPAARSNIRQIDVKPSPEVTTGKTDAVICDKCDGKHPTENCPYYKKARESHPDAQKGSKRLGGASKLPGATIRSARVHRQPGDGSCLFHSLSYGLRDGSSAKSLRKQICNFIAENPKLKIADTPLSDWVKWDSRSSVTQYARKMSGGAWGGGIEMAAFSKLKGVNVHVYEQSGGVFKRISAFDHEDSPETKAVIRVLYGGGVHYDALVA